MIHSLNNFYIGLHFLLPYRHILPLFPLKKSILSSGVLRLFLSNFLLQSLWMQQNKCCLKQWFATTICKTPLFFPRVVLNSKEISTVYFKIKVSMYNLTLIAKILSLYQTYITRHCSCKITNSLEFSILNKTIKLS